MSPESLKQPLRNVMSPPATASLSDQASDVEARLGPGHAVLVQGADGGPLGVLPEEGWTAPAEAGATLAAYQDRLLPVARTTPGATVQQALHGMYFDRTIRWHVVEEGGAVVGVVDPAVLFHLFAAAGARAPSFGATSLVTQLFGDPITAPPSLRYVCPGHPPHRVDPQDVQKRNPEGRALCPQHGKVMTAENS
jgi:hypothetical protein